MKEAVAVAFSGGLDTSWLVARYAEEGHPVTAISVNTGAWTDAGLIQLAAHAKRLGAVEHQAIEGRDALFDDHIAWLIRGNVLRGQTYPLCVGVERVVQARLFAEACHARGIKWLVHGSTGAGNDQIRFDTALRCIAPDVKVGAPIRDEARSREYTSKWLSDRGLGPMQSDAAVSINTGLWGTTAGGKWTHDPWSAPDGTWLTTTDPELAPMAEDVVIAWHEGLPVAVDEAPIQGWRAVQKVGEIGARHGIGRGVHLGDTILGIKGRVAFEAPGAAILLSAHRELEKLVLTGAQRFWKDHLADLYGQLVHEARYHEPLARDVEAFLASSQHRVHGETRVRLHRGNLLVTGVRSPFSLMDVQQTAYGEHSALWTGEEAKGFARIHGTPQILAARAWLRGTASS